MAAEKEMRWEQRFSNFSKALRKLTQAVEFIKYNRLDAGNRDDDNESGHVLDEMLKEGLIQRFEYTHELAWKVMKDYATYQGNSNIGGSRDATREAFQIGLISNGEIWMDMIGSRNKTSHTYHDETADEIYFKILSDYHPAFLAFYVNMDSKRTGQQGKLL